MARPRWAANHDLPCQPILASRRDGPPSAVRRRLPSEGRSHPNRPAGFCSRVTGHPLVRYGLPGEWSFWQPLAREYLRRCDELVVLRIEGWEESEGVRAEIEFVAALGKRASYKEPSR